MPLKVIFNFVCCHLLSVAIHCREKQNPNYDVFYHMLVANQPNKRTVTFICRVGPKSRWFFIKLKALVEIQGTGE
jgi:hypothetical protein